MYVWSLLCPYCPASQSVYGLAEEPTQVQSPVHGPLHNARKGTKEDLEKEVGG